MNRNITVILFFLLVLPMVIADDVNVSVNVTTPIPLCGGETSLSQMLCYIGHGTGNIFLSISPPLLILIVLMALGTALGYIFESVANKVGGK